MLAWCSAFPNRQIAVVTAYVPELGFSRQKTRAFHDLSRGIFAGRLDFQALTSSTNGDAIKFPLGLRGVGRWTAEYIFVARVGTARGFSRG
jgi:3-methyladenine DNA glycosylase/8-oxoguanine DNA glycosylase